MSEETPKMVPPIEENSMTAGEDSRPVDSPLEGVMPFAADEASIPSEVPPAYAAEEKDEGAYGAAVWHNGKKITGLWSKNENRNSWIGVSGLGWKKLANNSDTAVVALTMLSAHAKQVGSTVNLKVDSGQVKELYVW